ncbi:MAG: NAD(P)/FAD-dependent oxidoreductase [Pseudomonadales bacterium]|nr:NAD(P)/FAD-dependent oxidoreductase [Pseudomonadales bacterium]
MQSHISSDKRIIIVGAGFSGMGCAIKLLEAGHRNLVIYEKNKGVGGTWETNRYPGLTCDVPAIAYTYSFERSCEFSRQYPAWNEIRAYCQMVSDKYGLKEFIQFEKEISEATYSNDQWLVKTSDGASDTADIVIMATGVLRNLNYPDIEGLSSFEGTLIHTGRWDESLDLKGKRVGVIGTGATCTQLVPAIIDDVEQLVLFQRTAQWVAPFEGGNPMITEAQREHLRKHPEYLQKLADGMLDKIEKIVDGILIDTTGKTTQRIREQCDERLAEITDPVMRNQLTPDYEPGCKRLIWSETFYPAMQKDNAQLETNGIECIEANGIRTQNGDLHELDVIVLATGYKMHDYMRPMKIKGDQGQLLDDTWAQGEFAHRGIMIPGYPNLFMVMGPNSPLTNFSVIEVAEWQISYFLQLADLVLQGKAASVAPNPEAVQKFNDQLKERTPGTIWASGCNSYYLDQNGLPNVWPGSVASYRESMQSPDLNEYIIK